MRTDISRVTPEEFDKVLAILSERKLLKGSPADWQGPYVFTWRATMDFHAEVTEWCEDCGVDARLLDGRIYEFLVCADEVAAMAFKVRFG